MSRIVWLLVVGLFPLKGLFCQTIEDKVALLKADGFEKKEEGLSPIWVNQILAPLKKELEERCALVHQLVEEKAGEEEFLDLLEEVNALRREIQEVEARFRQEQSEELRKEAEPYKVWQQEGLTISQLIAEYGSQDYLYVIPQELTSIKVEMRSSLMIPKESFSSLLEAILKCNGVGIKEINAYARQLYVLKQDLFSVNFITSKWKDLQLFDAKARVAYLFSPPAEDLKNSFYFLERVRDSKSIFLCQVGSKIAIIGFQEDVKKLVTICQNLWNTDFPKVTKVLSLSKMHPEEAVKILRTYFNGLFEPSKSIERVRRGHDLSVIPLNKEAGIILVGSEDIVKRAEEVIFQTESQVNSPNELTVYWHTCSHSDPNELAEILEKVYASFVSSRLDGTMDEECQLDGLEDEIEEGSSEAAFKEEEIKKDFFFTGDRTKRGSKHFIPYAASGSILMIIQKNMLSKIKDVIKRFDIPDKMVELQVILCERILNHSSRSGMNLLKFGSGVSKEKLGGAGYYGISRYGSKGISEFLFRYLNLEGSLLLMLFITFSFPRRH